VAAVRGCSPEAAAVARKLRWTVAERVASAVPSTAPTETTTWLDTRDDTLTVTVATAVER
jgi:hypothetical protein